MLSDKTNTKERYMEHLHCSKEDKKNKHLTYRDRLRIEMMVKEGKSTGEIGDAIGKHQRTIQREMHRGKVQQLNGTTWEYYDTYDADTAQRKYHLEMEVKGPTLKIGKDHKLCNHIESELKGGKSPDVIAYEIGNSKDFTVKVCTKTIYNYLDKNIFLDVDYDDLPYGHYKKNKNKGMNRPSYKNLNGRSIEERPEEVKERKELGHWEMDLVVGGKGKSSEALLTITERVAKREIIKKIPDKTQQSVIQALDKMERQMGRIKFREMFKSITVDNGPEFLNSSEMERSCLSNNKLRTMVYYAHPYSAYERGTNENMNRMIRRFIPKGADISQYTHTEIKRIENWLNNYPRKILGYKTPLEIYGEVA
jgi:transposase, IS30 family